MCCQERLAVFHRRHPLWFYRRLPDEMPPIQVNMTLLLITDPIDRIGPIVRDQEGAVRQNEHIYRTPPGPASLQPTFSENFVFHRSIVLNPYERDAITNGRVPIP